MLNKRIDESLFIFNKQGGTGIGLHQPFVGIPGQGIRFLDSFGEVAVDRGNQRGTAESAINMEPKVIFLRDIADFR